MDYGNFKQKNSRRKRCGIRFYDTVKLCMVEKNIGCAATLGNVTTQPICNIIEKNQKILIGGT